MRIMFDTNVLISLLLFPNTRMNKMMEYDLVFTPDEMDTSLFKIRDSNDYPVLYTAIISDVDILITGDKDFEDVDIQKPEILTPTKFFEKYM